MKVAHFLRTNMRFPSTIVFMNYSVFAASVPNTPLNYSVAFDNGAIISISNSDTYLSTRRAVLLIFFKR
jgi:hypothetical protein